MNRRAFVKQSSFIAAATGFADPQFFTAAPVKNKLPKWKGFNLRDFNAPLPAPDRFYTTEEHLKWMRDWGFDFIRLPIAYGSLNAVRQPIENSFELPIQTDTLH